MSYPGEDVDKILAEYHPEGVRVVGTYRCNRNCKFCYQPTKSSEVLIPSRLDAIFTFMQAADFIPIYITYQGGELSLFPDDAIRYFKAGQNIFPQVFRKSLTTNGTATLSFYRSLKMYGITHLTFSLHNPDPDVEARIIALAHDGFFTVRVNCFMDLDQSHWQRIRYVYDFCRRNMVQLTLCEDLRQGESVLSEDYSQQTIYLLAQILGLERAGVDFSESKNQILVRVMEHEFLFWIYRHRDNYDYNNVIVLPDGSLTMTFDDVLNGKGCSSEAEARLRERS